MGKIIRLTEADLTRLVSKVIKEQSKVMMDKVASSSSSSTKPKVMTDKMVSSSQNYNMIDTCASMGVKSPGYCDTRAKKPVKSCASLGVKTPGVCYVDTKKLVPGLPPKQGNSVKSVGMKEQKSRRPLLTEAAAQMAIDDAEERIASGERPDPKMMAQIKQCITTKQLTSLMFLTTSAGAYALGVIAMLCASGVGFAVGGILALSSILVIFITGLSEEDGGLGADPSKDIKALLSCVKL
jgi:hypothetical protein